MSCSETMSDIEERGAKRTAQQAHLPMKDAVRGDPQPHVEPAWPSKGTKRTADQAGLRMADALRGDLQPRDETVWLDEVSQLEFANKTQHGPPWYDEITGEALDEQEVTTGMEKEWTSLKDFGVLEPCTKEFAIAHGCKTPVELR